MQKILFHLPFSLLRLESCVLCLNNSDYSHYLVWIAKPFNTNVLQHFHQKIMITSITYSLANDYYMHYLTEKSKIRKPRQKAENWAPYDYLSSQFHQVMPFSLFHCASNAPQTMRRQALSVILTNRNKTEMPYQVMRKTAGHGCTHEPIDLLTNTGSPDVKFILDFSASELDKEWGFAVYLISWRASISLRIWLLVFLVILILPGFLKMGQTAIKTILVVDDDEDVRESITYALNEEGYNAIPAADEEHALDFLNEEQIDLMITALKVPTIDGMKLLGIAQERYPKVDVIMMASSTSVEMAVEAIKAGAHDFHTKPINMDKLKLSVGEALGKQIIVAQDIGRHHPLDSEFGLTGFVGNSEKMQRVYRTIAQVAPAMTNVLLYGETGSGKSLAARAIHYNSSRRNEPFIELSCAALPETIIESELFGHERGAFTHAINAKKGRFELAHGGTLFLNDVSDISPYTQVKLLRVLEDREFERVGGMETIKVDVRFIAATNRSLEEAIEEGRFREDLYYRLRTVIIELPSLRERKEDIPLLVEHFVRDANRLNNKNVTGITDQAMQYLMKYDWPGNVRELKNCIEGMVVMTTRATLGVYDLPKHITRSGDDSWSVNIHVGMSVKDAERELIVETLKYTNNNKALAAKILNMGLRTLFRKVKEYEIA